MNPIFSAPVAPAMRLCSFSMFVICFVGCGVCFGSALKKLK